MIAHCAGGLCENLMNVANSFLWLNKYSSDTSLWLTEIN